MLSKILPRLSIFLSTPSARRATLLPPQRLYRSFQFLSTPSARRATFRFSPAIISISISIHALREEGDRQFQQFRSAFQDFYPRPPRGGRRSFSVRPAGVHRHFYPRPPRGGRQKRLPLHHVQGKISIHALREEGDLQKMQRLDGSKYFYPRPPRGGRLAAQGSFPINSIFLSTPSARRATGGKGRSAFYIRFLSTPSARRATVTVLPAFIRSTNFYPRPPRGGRQKTNFQ